jgi:hypothetical protein
MKKLGTLALRWTLVYRTISDGVVLEVVVEVLELIDGGGRVEEVLVNEAEDVVVNKSTEGKGAKVK